MECWNCQAETHGAPFCPSCGRIGPRSPGATHFDVFGLKRSFDLDVGALEQKFRELSLKLHPDRFAQADAKERRFSLEQTSSLNEAFKTLKDPAKRAFYLLQLHGVTFNEEGGSSSVQMPQDFLLEILDMREALDGARDKKDYERVAQMADDVRTRQSAAMKEAAEALRALEQDAKNQDAKKKASQSLGRVRYFARFLEEVEAIEEEALS